MDIVNVPLVQVFHLLAASSWATRSSSNHKTGRALAFSEKIGPSSTPVLGKTQALCAAACAMADSITEPSSVSCLNDGAMARKEWRKR